MKNNATSVLSITFTYLLIFLFLFMIGMADQEILKTSFWTFWIINLMWFLICLSTASVGIILILKLFEGRK